MIILKNLIVLVFACLMVSPVFAEKADRWRHVKKSIQVDIITTSVDESTKSLVVEFKMDLGNVVVTVADSEGNITYQEAVQTGAVPTLIIPLNITEGTISITDGENLIYQITNF